jgi:hypothetical protein
MKNLASVLFQNLSSISFFAILGIIILLVVSKFHDNLYNLVVIVGYLIDSSQDKNLFDMNFMTEEERKLHMFTLLNTKINREQSGNTDYYVNEGRRLFF